MKSFKQFLKESKSFSTSAAKKLGSKLNVDWSDVSLDQFTMGLDVEQEHNKHDGLDVVDSDLDLAKIVLAHLKELPDYYTRLKKMEDE